MLQSFSRDEHLEITENFTVKSCALLKPITIYGDVVGSVIILSDKIDEIEKVLIESSSSFISKYLES